MPVTNTTSSVQSQSVNPENLCLKKGDGLKGQPLESVAILQERLQILLGRPCEKDGKYGNQTTQRVSEYQTQRGVEGKRGVADYQTIQRIDSDFRLETSRNLSKWGQGSEYYPVVRMMQYQLKNGASLNLQIDGLYGDETFGRVSEFQLAEGYQDSGVACPKTLQRLNQRFLLKNPHLERSVIDVLFSGEKVFGGSIPSAATLTLVLPKATTKASMAQIKFEELLKHYPNCQAPAALKRIGAEQYGWKNACAARVSHALGKSGIELPRGRRGLYTERSSQGLNIAPRVLELDRYLTKLFGPPDIVVEIKDSSDRPQELKGKKGIITFHFEGQNRTLAGTTGHMDLWNDDTSVYYNCFHRANKVSLRLVGGS